MYWQEKQDEDHSRESKRVTDVVYRMQCRMLPMDHAHSLSSAIHAALPWFAEERDAGLHLIHGAESGNGWERPDGSDELLLLSRRTRLQLRVPIHRLDDALALSGRALDVAGHELVVGDGSARPLNPNATLYARYLLSDPEHSEDQFMAWVAEAMHDLNITPKKMLPGRSKRIRHPDGDWFTRSLMIADLDDDDALRLLERGLGPGRKMGCGLFVPHKSIKHVEPED
jgi:CRISPR-associated protein Cas6